MHTSEVSRFLPTLAEPPSFTESLRRYSTRLNSSEFDESGTAAEPGPATAAGEGDDDIRARGDGDLLNTYFPFVTCSSAFG